MTRTTSLVALLLLAACATPDAPPPQVSTRTVEVRVPVPIPCIAAADIPAAPTPTRVDTERATTDQLAAAAAADLIALDSYRARVQALLAQCAAGGPL